VPGATITRLTGALRTDRHLRREAESMWLYVSIVLLSALSVFDDDHPPGHGDIVLLEVGTTAGLVLAHGFASWVSSRLTSGPPDEVESWDLLWVQLGGALTVAALAIVAVMVAPTSVELPVARLTVAGAIAALVYVESRTSRSPARAGLYGLLALAAGVTVALLKSVLAH
jgi:uncharacterized membrane-anchored protein